MAVPSSGMPRLRGRIHVQNADKPVDEKQRQDQLWDVLQGKQYRSILIATLAVGAVAATARSTGRPMIRQPQVARAITSPSGANPIQESTAIGCTSIGRLSMARRS